MEALRKKRELEKVCDVGVCCMVCGWLVMCGCSYGSIQQQQKNAPPQPVQTIAPAPDTVSTIETPRRQKDPNTGNKSHFNTLATPLFTDC